MKHGIELNGVANIKLLMDNDPAGESYDRIQGQLLYLEKYMIAYCEAINKGIKPPFWHEITANPKLYLTNRERTGK